MHNIITAFTAIPTIVNTGKNTCSKLSRGTCRSLWMNILYDETIMAIAIDINAKAVAVMTLYCHGFFNILNHNSRDTVKISITYFATYLRLHKLTNDFRHTND